MAVKYIDYKITTIYTDGCQKKDHVVLPINDFEPMAAIQRTVIANAKEENREVEEIGFLKAEVVIYDREME